MRNLLKYSGQNKNGFPWNKFKINCFKELFTSPLKDITGGGVHFDTLVLEFQISNDEISCKEDYHCLVVDLPPKSNKTN